MNGRIYDDKLARFLQPDPVIQAPGNSQSWNAYTYVFNNPLAYTDPTGEFGILGGLAIGWAMHNYVHKGMIRSAMRAIGPQATGLAVGVGCSFAGPWGILCAAGGSYDAARAFGASSKEARQAAVAGAFTAAVSYGVNVKYGGQVTPGSVAITAMAGGIAAEIQGGNFGNGFVAAGLTAAVMPQVGYIQNDFARTVVGALVGGTISEATGGKFANGAISGAIQGAMARKPRKVEDYFNHADLPDGELDGVPTKMPSETRAALKKILRSSLGRKLSAYMDKNGGKIDLVEVPVAEAFHQIGDNEVWYTRDVAAYVAMNVANGNSLPGDGLDTSTLDSLLAHEIGHTVIGAAAVNQVPIPVYNKADSFREESRAIRSYENPYRESRGMPLRCSYWTEGDLCS